jgi:hypothetical protein
MTKELQEVILAAKRWQYDTQKGTQRLLVALARLREKERKKKSSRSKKSSSRLRA